MNDDWRVQVTCPTTATAANLGELLREGDFQHQLQDAAGERVVVSVDGHQLFLYTGTREQADSATEDVRSLTASSGVSVTTELRRWHPVAEDWVDADQPLPVGEAAVAAERAELIEDERQEQSQAKYAEYEVRVSTSSHRETVELAEKLGREGVESLRRWRFLLIGATDEDSANALAERVRAIAPPDAAIEVEGSYRNVQAELGPNPFAVFGGLGV